MSQKEYDRRKTELFAAVDMPTSQWLRELDALEAKRDYIVSGQEARNLARTEKRQARRIPLQLRRQILDDVCHYCGELFPNEVDHVIPVSKGGLTVLNNLVAACRRCNAEKLDFTPDEWREWRLSEGLEWPPKNQVQLLRERIDAIPDDQREQVLAGLNAWAKSLNAQ